MAEANVQTRSVIKEDFTVVGESPVVTRVGTFGGSTIMPVMTRNGYEDHEVSLMTCEKVLFATPPEPRIEITRTQTGQVFFVQGVDNKDPVLFTFILTEREV